MQKIKSSKSFRILIVIAVIILLITIGVTMIILAKKGMGIPCIFNKLTSLECAGCGNTRAAIAMLKLDFKSAFNYNPLSFLEFFYLAWIFIFSAINYIKGIGLKYQFPLPIIDYICWAAILIWFVLRNFI